MADTEILDACVQQVRIPVLVDGGAKSPEALKVGLGAIPALAMMKESFRPICRFSPTPFDR